MGFDEFFRRHNALRDSAVLFREAHSASPARRQTAAGAAGGVVDAAFVGGEHLDEAAHDAGQGVELMNAPAFTLRAACGSLSRAPRMATVLPLGAGEAGEKQVMNAGISRKVSQDCSKRGRGCWDQPASGSSAKTTPSCRSSRNRRPSPPPADQRLKFERGGGDAGFIEGPIFSFRCGCGAAAP